jgi:hypothetical protein
VGGVDAGAGPLGRVRGVVEAGGGVKDRAPGRERVGGFEGALRDSVGDDPGKLPDEGLDVGFDDLTRVCGQLDIGGEELGVVERLGAFGVDEQVEPALEALWGGALPTRSSPDGLADAAFLRQVTRQPCGKTVLVARTAVRDALGLLGAHESPEPSAPLPAQGVDCFGEARLVSREDRARRRLQPACDVASWQLRVRVHGLPPFALALPRP